MTATDRTLSVDSLRFGYPGRPLFDDWSHAFAPGLTWIRGDNGCGKSTLLRLLAGALEPQSGRIRYASLDPVDDALEYRRRVGWFDVGAPTSDPLKPTEFLSSIAKLHATFDDALATSLVESLGLQPFLPRRLRELSTGSRRKVGLIAAIAAGTDVVLLDEPLAALDRRSSDVVERLLTAAARQYERTWIVVSHVPLGGGDARVLPLASRDDVR